jgi:hypothetical protein
MRLNKCILSIGLLVLLPGFADAMFCPSNFNEINIGDTLEKVTGQCGKPSKQENSVTSPSGPQEWTYFIKMNPNDTGSLKTVVTFNNKKVINIMLNNASVANTPFCGGGIRVGDSSERIKAACGVPAIITEGQNEGTASKITKLLYDGMPKVGLTFIDGKLVSRD